MFRKTKIKLLDEIERLKAELRSLTYKKEELERVNKNLEGELSTLKNQHYEDVADCDFYVDFIGLKAFSIERLFKDNKETTYIGYLKPDGSISEWVFYCSRETHKRLAREFSMAVLGIDNQE